MNSQPLEKYVLGERLSSGGFHRERIHFTHKIWIFPRLYQNTENGGKQKCSCLLLKHNRKIKRRCIGLAEEAFSYSRSYPNI